MSLNKLRVFTSGSTSMSTWASVVPRGKTAPLLYRKRGLCRISSTLVVAPSAAAAAAASVLLKGGQRLSHNVVGSGPTGAQLRQLFICSAIPMVGFGFMDNFVMITAGSYIDATMGVTLGVSMLTAAALGNAVSDVSGVLFGGALERTISQLNFFPSKNKPPPLTVPQRALSISRNVHTAGSVLGVFCGCLLGASTLFFRGQVFDDHHQQQQQQHSNNKMNNNDTMVQKLIQMHLLDNVEQTSIHYRNNSSSSWSYCAKSCLQTGKPVRASRNDTGNTNNNEKEEDEVFAIMCVPVTLEQHDEGTNVVAVIEFLRRSTPFTKQDENMASVLANATGVLLQTQQSNQAMLSL